MTNLNTLGLLLQMVVALGVVLAVMWLAARLVRTVGPVRNEELLEVVARQQVGRSSSVAVVRVADQALVLGVTDGQVALLAEVELEQVEQAVKTVQAQREQRREERQALLSTLPRARAVRRAQSRTPRGTAAGTQAKSDSKLQGSILAPSTWRQAVEVLRDRTTRRG